MADTTIFLIKGENEKVYPEIGRFLGGMVTPNIGAFIVGRIVALFIDTGQFPNNYHKASAALLVTVADRL